MNWVLIGVLALVNIPIYILLAQVIFGSWGDFLEAVRFTLQPDIWSLFKGEYWADWSAELHMSAFLIVCALTVAAEYALIMKIFG